MRTCPACEEGKLHRKSLDDVEYNYRGVTYNIGRQTVLVCDSCGEEITTGGEMQRLQEVAADMHRERIDNILEEKSDDRMYIRMPGTLKREIEREARLHHRKPHQWVKWALVKKLQDTDRGDRKGMTDQGS